MEFFLTFRDTAGTALLELRSPHPLPVPEVGDKVSLFEEDDNVRQPGALLPDPVLRVCGTVTRREWGYRPRQQPVTPDTYRPTVDTHVQVFLDL